MDFPGNADSASPDPVEGTVQSIVYLSASRKFLSLNAENCCKRTTLAIGSSIMTGVEK